MYLDHVLFITSLLLLWGNQTLYNYFPSRVLTRLELKTQGSSKYTDPNCPL
jgi:hypothetical protein